MAGTGEIQLYDPVGAIRARPASWLGALGDPRIRDELLREVVGRSIACATVVRVALDGDAATVEDDSATSADVLEQALTHLATPERGLLVRSGIVVTCALSSVLEADTGGRRMRFEHGRLVASTRTATRGTRIRFVPDTSILPAAAWDPLVLRELAALVPRLRVIADGGELRYRGISDHVAYLAAGRERDEPLHLRAFEDGVAIDIALAWTDGPTAIAGFVDYRPRTAPLAAAIAGAIESVFARRGGGRDLTDGLVAMVHIPRDRDDAGDAVQRVLEPALERYLDEHPALLDWLLLR